MNFEDMKYFAPAEDLVKVLKNKNQSEEDLFFRVIVAYYFSKVASIMRTQVVTLDRGTIPTNLYALNLAVSGFGKGRSINIIEEDILSGFKNKFMSETLPKVADTNLTKLAVERATKAGTDPDKVYEGIMREYASTGAYLFNFDSGTGPAVKQLRHQLLLAGAGSINLEMDEVGANFSNNIEVLNTFIELYDVGKVKPKITKSTTESVRHESLDGSTPTNLLLFGTPSKLLDGGRSEQDFYGMLDMGYARRLMFSYVDKVHKIKGLTPEEVFDLMTDTSTDLYIKSLYDQLESLADVSNFGMNISIDKATTLELIAYQQDCGERAEAFRDHQDMEKAELTHRYFRALKLAGTYAFIDGSKFITIPHLHAAIKLVEDSGTAFSKILKREKPYVKLAKYIADINKEVTHVDLVEDLPFYKGSEAQKRDLLNLAIAYGYKNNIIIKKTYIDSIEFLKGESLPKTDLDKLTISYSADMTYSYENSIARFDELQELIKLPNYHFTSHHWKEGHRNKGNLIQGFNTIILDVDHGVTLATARELLRDYQHIIYTTKRHTKDKNRFRVILPMSHHISLSSEEYSKFMVNVFEWAPFEVDEATKDVARKWQTNDAAEYYTNSGTLIDAMSFIPQTKKSEELSLARQQISSMSNLEAWFFRSIGEGSRNNLLLRYGLALMNNGYNLDSVRNGMFAFNGKLHDPIDETELHSTCMVTITKKFLELEMKG